MLETRRCSDDVNGPAPDKLCWQRLRDVIGEETRKGHPHRTEPCSTLAGYRLKFLKKRLLA